MMASRASNGFWEILYLRSRVQATTVRWRTENANTAGNITGRIVFRLRLHSLIQANSTCAMFFELHLLALTSWQLKRKSVTYN
jgi:hypothetical protein